MLHSFGGTARSRPRVNLGGKKKELSKDELLRKAAQERQLREDVRRRDTASRIIQRQWLTWRARMNVMDTFRRHYDLQIEKLFKSKAEYLEHIEIPWSEFFYFFNAKLDLRRALALPRVFDAGSINGRPSMDPTATLVLRRCVVLTLLKNEIQPEMCLHLMQFLSQLNIEAAGHVDSLNEAADNYFNVLDGELSRAHFVDDHEPFSLALVNCIMQPFRMDIFAKPTPYFCKYILANDHFQDFNLPKIVAVEIESSRLIHGFSLLSIDNEVDKAFARLGNIIQISKNTSCFAATANDRSNWCRVVSNFLRCAWDSTIHRHIDDTRSVEGHRSVEQEQEGEISAQDATRVHSHWKTLAQYPRQQIDSLVQNQMVKCLLSTEFVPEYASLFCALITFFPGNRDQLLMNLSLFATAANSPYNLLSTSFTSWQHHNSAIANEVDKRQIPDILVFYLEVLSRVLTTMVDDEFFNPQKSQISLEQIKITATNLKPIAYDLLYRFNGLDRAPMLCTTRAAYCQDLVARVLQQIQVRDARRPFLPKDFWLYAERVDVSRVIQAMTASGVSSEEAEDDDMIGLNTMGLTRTEYQKWTSPHEIMVLNFCPFFFPFYSRIEILQSLIDHDAEANGFNDFFGRPAKHLVVCRRDHEFEDGLEALWPIGSGIKGPLSVDYLDAHGLPEAGIDGGGLTKEFLTSVCKQAFHPDFGLFVETPERLLFPNPDPSARSPARLRHYEYLGRIIAKCIYDGILVDVAFASFFLLNWIGKLAYLDDLQALDKDLYHGLLQLKNYSGDVENDLTLDFTTNEEEADGTQRTINLLPNGSQIAVTKANRLQYIHLICNFKLNARIARQSQAFVRGMASVLDLRWLAMFSQSEMQALVGGNPVPIDVDDLKANTVYGGYTDQDVTIRLFWRVIREFSNEEKRSLIKFVTSTPRPPLLGFGELNPKFSVRFAGGDVGRLPTASTCVNLLKLPAYKTIEQMRNKLRLSITAEAGFDLS